MKPVQVKDITVSGNVLSSGDKENTARLSSCRHLTGLKY